MLTMHAMIYMLTMHDMLYKSCDHAGHALHAMLYIKSCDHADYALHAMCNLMPLRLVVLER